MQRIHMQDQVENRIEDIMNEKVYLDWETLFQDAISFTLIVVFITFGINI